MDLPPQHVVRAIQGIGAAMDYPMHIVTCTDGRAKSGCLVGFATQISVYPPRWIVGISRENHTHGVASRASHLAIHFPQVDDRDLAALFGSTTGDEIDKFERYGWHAGTGGVPLLDRCANWLVGETVEQIQAGDHTAFLLQIVDASCADSPRFITYQQLKNLHPGHEVETPRGYPQGSRSEA